MIGFLFFATSCSVQSKINQIDKDATPLIDSFFSSIQKKEVALAIDNLLASNSNISLTDSATLFLRGSFNFINEVSGSFMGYRLLKKRYIENDIAIYSYLSKYDKKFYRFIFIFYNNGVKTKLYKFLFDEGLDSELEGSLKFYEN